MRVLCVYVLPVPDKFKAAADRFAESWRLFDPGVEHGFLLVRKGAHIWEGPHPNAVWPWTGDDGYDILALQRAAETDCDLVMLMSSTGQIYTDRWLEKYVAAFDDLAVAAVSATGSYATGHSVYARNPHLRTANIMVRAKALNDLNLPEAHTKEECWHFEHGDNSLTRHLHNQKYRCVVIDCHGKTYGIEDWKSSETFWCGSQRGLIIGDHQTDRYRVSNPEARKELEHEAWEK